MMDMVRRPLIESITLDSILSYGPGFGTLELHPLNVLIGANGSGKSNLIEILDVLSRTPEDLAAVIRTGGGVNQWIWKGSDAGSAGISIVANLEKVQAQLRYGLRFAASLNRLELIDEYLDEARPRATSLSDVYFYYRYQNGSPAINVRSGNGDEEKRKLDRQNISPEQSVLAQRRDPDLYPELTSLANAFSKIAIYREWTFGRKAPLRNSQPADLPNDVLLPDASNLGLVVNKLEHSDVYPKFIDAIRRFLPRFSQILTSVEANTVQLFLREDGLRTPVPAARLSDGTIRFIALLTILLQPERASLICLEEPELGLHPDAIFIIADLLVAASKTTQVIVTTHSDILVNRLTESVESVLVVENNRGATQIRRLDSEKLAFWLNDYQLGDIWRMGEIGGNP